MNTNTIADTKGRKHLTTKDLVMIGFLGAISAILMYFEFPVPLVPGFIKMDFSELPIIIGGFMMGPLAGAFIIIIKILLHFILSGTTTMGIGELANMIGSFGYMLPAVILYRKWHTKKGAIVTLVIATLVVSVLAVTVNIVLMFPAYAALFGISIDRIVEMGRVVNPNVKNLITLMLFSVLPFNLFKYGIVSLLTFFVYKRLGKILRYL